MYVFLYQPGVVKKTPIGLPSLFNEKSEIKKVKWKFFMEKGKVNFSIHWTPVRDWRGSNPQLPPWQGGALTNWTTIPAGCMAYIPIPIFR